MQIRDTLAMIGATVEGGLYGKDSDPARWFPWEKEESPPQELSEEALEDMDRQAERDAELEALVEGEG